MTTPTICSIVPYTLTKEDSKTQNKRRGDATTRQQYNQHTGVQTYVGNVVNEGDVFPLVITRVWTDGSVNGQILFDGNDQLWVTSVKGGTGPGTFSASVSSEKSASKSASPPESPKSTPAPAKTTTTESPKFPSPTFKTPRKSSVTKAAKTTPTPRKKTS